MNFQSAYNQSQPLFSTKQSYQRLSSVKKVSAYSVILAYFRNITLESRKTAKRQKNRENFLTKTKNRRSKQVQS